MKTATDRAAEVIAAAEMMFSDEMGASLDLGPAARTALIEKIGAAIRTAVAEEHRRPELSDEEVAAILNLIDHIFASGPLSPSPHLRTLRAIRAKLLSTLPPSPRSSAIRTVDTEVP